MKKVKLWFADFPSGFDSTNNYFFRTLCKHYEIELSESPDILIFSNFGEAHKLFPHAVRIFFSGENQSYAGKQFDFLVDHQYMASPRHFRLPLFVCFDDYFRIQQARSELLILKDVAQRKFCNFIFSNDRASERKVFFNRLSEYKQVDSAGKVLNNLGYCVKNKRKFIQDYKFTIAFENSAATGYTTEKLLQPLVSRSLPIYWGNPNVAEDFNENAFLRLDDMHNMDSLIETIVKIDNDDHLLLKYLNAPSFPNNNTPPNYYNDDDFVAWFDKAITFRPTRISRWWVKKVESDGIYAS